MSGLKMKTSILFRVGVLLVLSISFLPLAISGLPPLIRLPTADWGVLDTDGNPVVAGAKYYVIPALIGEEGGVSLTTLNTANPSVCPADVVMNLTIAGSQSPAVGRPITFYPLHGDGDDSSIQLQSPLNVAFYSSDPSDPCAKLNVWKLQATIVTGGVIGDEDDIYSWFRIHKNYDGRGYIFKWWPSLCPGCFIRIFNIGTVGFDGIQLGINEEFPYPFEFVKAAAN